MKFLLILTLSVFTVSSFAKTKAQKAEWKEARMACKSKDSALKGKMLKKCIREEMKSKTESSEAKPETKPE